MEHMHELPDCNSCSDNLFLETSLLFDKSSDLHTISRIVHKHSKKSIHMISVCPMGQLCLCTNLKAI